MVTEKEVPPRIDVLIIVGAGGEDDAVRAVEASLNGIQEGILDQWAEIPRPKDYPFAVRACMFRKTGSGAIRFALSRAYLQGTDSTAIAATQLIDFYKPKCIAMCGICGGRPGEVNVGDVVIADAVYRYDIGKTSIDNQTGEADSRPDIRTYLMPPGWKQKAENYRLPDSVRTSLLKNHPGASEGADKWRIHCGIMATGSKNQRYAAVWEEITQHQRKAVALDMEAAAIGLAAHLTGIPFIVVKGVSDTASAPTEPRVREFAAKASAEVLISFLRDHFGQDRSTAALLDPLMQKKPAGWAKGEIGSYGELLDSHCSLVPFDEALRKEQMDLILGWCAEPAETSARLFHGPGGTGKTRLLIEAAKRMEDRGWISGGLPDDVKDSDLRVILDSPEDMFLVVDYAERRPALSAFLQQAATRKTSGTNLRIALIAREEADWWQQLPKDSREIASIIGGAMAVRVNDVPRDSELRKALFAEARDAFIVIVKKEALQRLPDLSDPLFNSILYIHLASLATAMGEEVLPGNLLTWLLDHEKHLWRYGVTGQDALSDDRALKDRSLLAMAAVLLQGIPESDRADELAATLKLREASVAPEVLHRIYGRPDGPNISPLRPDILGEALVAEVLAPRETPKDFLESVFRGTSFLEITTGLYVLDAACRLDTRVEGKIEEFLSADFANRAAPALAAALAVGRRKGTSPLGAILGRAAKELGGLAEAELFYDNIPQTTVSLCEAILWAMEILVTDARKEKSTEESKARLAGLLNDLSSRYRALRRTDIAFTAIVEAVRHYRELIAANLAAYLGNLATSLNNLSIICSDLDHPDESLAAIEEAVRFFRKLADEDRTGFLAGLSMSLSNLATCYFDLGRVDDALATIQEAIEYRRELVTNDRTSFLKELASSLYNLARMYSDLGRAEDSLSANLEAVEHFRELASADRAGFLAGLASSLDNLGACCFDLNRLNEALTATEEAVRYRRELIAANRAGFLGDLARSLNNLSNTHSALGRTDDTLAAIGEAVKYYRELTAADRAGFLGDLMLSLNNLSAHLSTLGRHAEALAAIEEAVSYRTELVAANGARHLHNLAMALGTFAQMSARAGKLPAALESGRECLRLFTELTARTPTTYANRLIQTLLFVAKIASDTGAGLDSIPEIGVAVQLLDKLGLPKKQELEGDLPHEGDRK